MSRRVIYLLEPFTAPFGGVAVIYRHAEILAANGIRAFVALPQKPEIDFYAVLTRGRNTPVSA
jgi:hypothetical protein